ncbi:Maf family protein [Marinicrinis sediminis]|uniref:dTTP/UTP pyrophosphatase n=1 Tax=Marinicrinis sediminis TaxID=1652465 RepID=A0ABW5R6T2_9BACL
MIILASSSPRRKELLGLLSLSFEVIPSHADETIEESLPPGEIVEELSFRKAREVLGAHPKITEGIVIGSDTIVVLNERKLGKPSSPEEAEQMLHALQGGPHYVYSGIACLDAASGKEAVSHKRTRVYMKELSAAQIRRYVATGEPMDKAGAYAIQGRGAALVDRIEGDYFNVVGMSVSLLADMLGEFGIEIP